MPITGGASVNLTSSLDNRGSSWGLNNLRFSPDSARVTFQSRSSYGLYSTPITGGNITGVDSREVWGGSAPSFERDRAVYRLGNIRFDLKSVSITSGDLAHL